jgi:predicted Zn finger-like uncharacterized protein
MASARTARKRGRAKQALKQIGPRFDTTIRIGYSFAVLMDVKCEQCSAEYEFDESLLGEKGTTVKCAACNHVFRVLPRRKDDSRAQLQVRYVRT